MSELVTSTEKLKKKRPKLFQKLVSLFIGVPALVTSLGYAQYRSVYKEPIQRSVNISELFRRVYETKDLKDSFMDMIADSDYDPVTQSFLIGAANIYRDTLQSEGLAGLNNAIADNIAPSVSEITEIVTIEDEETRKIAILTESLSEKSNQSLLSIIKSDEFDTSIQRILLTQKDEMTLEDAKNQETQLSIPEAHHIDQNNDLLPLVEGLSLELQTVVLPILSDAKRTIIINDSVSTTFDDEKLRRLAEEINSYYAKEGPEATQFLVNILLFKGVSSECLPENITTTFKNISRLYEFLTLKDQTTLHFFLNNGAVKPEYIGNYANILKLYLDPTSEITIPTEVFDSFNQLVDGDTQLASVLFLRYILYVNGEDSANRTIDPSEFSAQLQELRTVKLINKFSPNYKEMLFMTMMFGSLQSYWPEDTLSEIRQNPEKLKMAENYFYQGIGADKVELAYKYIFDKLPAAMTFNCKNYIFYLVRDAIQQSTTSFTTEEISEMLGTEVISIGDVNLMDIDSEFAFSDSDKQKTEKSSIDIPLVFSGYDDGFFAFDDSFSVITPNLENLPAEELLPVLSQFHYLYTLNGELRYGSITDILSKVPSVNSMKDLITALKQINVKSLTRVLPVNWSNSHPSNEGHVRRINSNEFTGLAVITDEHGVVLRQLAIVIPAYQLMELNKTSLEQVLNVQPGQDVDVLLPDAGFATKFSNGKIDPKMLTLGNEANEEGKSMRFFIK